MLILFPSWLYCSLPYTFFFNHTHFNLSESTLDLKELNSSEHKSISQINKTLLPLPTFCAINDIYQIRSDQISRSVVSETFDPMNRSTPGLPVHHKLPELAQTHVHQVSDTIQPSHPLSSPSIPTFSLSQHQGLFQ